MEVYEQEDSYVIKANYKLKLTDKLIRDLANMFTSIWNISQIRTLSRNIP